MTKHLMKRITALFLTAAVMVSVCSGCAQKADSANVNKKYADKGMVNLLGQPYNYQGGTADKRSGLGFTFSYLTEKGLNMITKSFEPGTEAGKPDTSKGAEKNGPELSTMSDQTANEADTKDESFNYAAIYRIANDTENKTGQAAMKYLTDNYSNKKVIAVLGDYTYYFAWNKDYSALKDLSEMDKKNLDALIANRDNFVNSTCIFPGLSDNAKTNMKDFQAKTLDGGTFSQKDFAKYDITMVNIWTTWCGYCVEEMPELQALYEKLPKNMNMISICCDADTESELAKEILSKKSCKFPSLIPDEKLQKSLLNKIDGYPTTVFVDSEGNIIGDAQTGAPSQKKEEVADAYLTLMKERLEMSSELN